MTNPAAPKSFIGFQPRNGMPFACAAVADSCGTGTFFNSGFRRRRRNRGVRSGDREQRGKCHL